MTQLELPLTFDPDVGFDWWSWDPQQRRLWRLAAERGIETIRL